MEPDMINLPKKSLFSSGFGALALLLALTGMVHGQSVWKWRSPYPHGSQIHDLVFENGRFLALENNGNIVTSTDGDTWTTITVERGKHLHCTAWGNGRFVIVGDSGAIYTSPDASQWTRRNSGTSWRLESVAYGDGIFVAVGDSGTIVTSPDGMQWTLQESGTDIPLYLVFHHQGQFLVYQEGRTSVLTSSNGSTWTKRNPTTSSADPPRSLTYGADLFVGAGYSGILYSVDGLKWVSGKVEGGYGVGIAAIIYAKGQFVAVGRALDVQASGTIYTSTDGKKWMLSAFRPAYALRSIAFGNDRFVAIGPNGILVTSSDGIHWSEVQEVSTKDLASVAFGMNRWVAVGDSGTILFSKDATTWNRALSRTADYLFSVAYGNGAFVAVGCGYETGGSILRSSDGENWTLVHTDTSECLRTVAFGNQQFMTAAYDGVFTSSDGMEWTKKVTDTAHFFEVTYGAGRFVGIGDGLQKMGEGEIGVSTDGATWTKVHLDSAGIYTSLNFVNGKFLVTGLFTGEIHLRLYSSPDGLHWTREYAVYPWVKAYVNGQYVATGFEGEILTSPDGKVWARVVAPMNDISSLIYENGKFIAVGEGGTILTSEPDGGAAISKSGFKDRLRSQTGIAILGPRIEVALPLRDFSHGTFEIRLFNLAGKEVFSHRLQSENGTLSFPIPQLAPGVHVIKVKGSNLNLTSSYLHH